jgi:hypothetical protein
LYEWIVCLDADERIRSKLRAEIEYELKNAPEGDAYVAPRKSRFINKWILHSGWYPDYRHSVFFNKNKMKYKDQLVHEDIDYRGEKLYFQGEILHYPYDSIKHFMRKSDFYTDLRAKEIFQEGKKFKILNVFVNPIAMFVKIILLKKDSLTV